MLKSFSSQHRYSEQERAAMQNQVDIIPLPRECLENCFDTGHFEEAVKQMFFVQSKPKEEDDDVKPLPKDTNDYDDDSDPHSGNNSNK